MRVTLRNYQAQGVSEIREWFRRGARAVLYVAPTGSGKTATFSYIAESAAARGNTVLILVHRQELLLQGSRSLGRIGVAHGLIAPGHTPTRDTVQIASVQTLVRRIKKQQFKFALVIVDEAHHAVAGSWRKVLDAMPEARILGVTATPERADGQGLGVEAGGIFERLVLGPSVASLVADGYLAPPVVYAPPSELDLTGVRSAGGDYERKELEGRVDRPRITGDAVAHYRKLSHQKPAIAFCVSIAHAEHVAAEFRAAGYQAISVDGKLPDAERKRRIEALGTGHLHVLTSCDIISEGTDIPIVTTGIMLRPTKSLSLWLQQCGRVLRPAEDKPHAIILDHVGNCTRPGLGMPDDEREWSLEGKKRTAREDDEQAKPLAVRQCPQCFAAHRPAAVCPVCGHVYAVESREIEQAEGELEQITPEKRERMKRLQKAEERGAKTLDELIALATRRGYKNPEGWARVRLGLRKQYREKYARRSA